jgi:AcrR family transcriptional regulator
MPNSRSFVLAGNSKIEDVLPERSGRPTETRLMQAAVVAFAERGYHGVSVRDLTGEVGIQASSFYSHFRSKDRLLFEIMALGYREHQAHVRNALLAAGANAHDQLTEAMRANVTFQGTYPLLTIVCNTELHALRDENRDRILGLRHDTGALIEAVIERGNALGDFSCAHPWLAVMAVGAMGQRVAWWYRPPASTGDASPLSNYPSEAAKWLSKDYDLDTIANEYAEYALSIVGYRRP